MPFGITKKIRSNRKLFENFTSLSILQFSNYIIPLITFPYLVRVLGPSKYGLINFAAAFTGYFGIITDYGFNLSATKEISINRDDKERVSSIFSAVLYIKFFLFLICSVVFIGLVFSFGKFRDESYVYLLSYASLFGLTIFPMWYFQGTENMKYIIRFNLTSKIAIMLLIFLLVREESDFIKVIALYSSGSIIVGLASLAFVRYYFNVKIKFPGMKEIKYQLDEGWYVFLSTLSISLYTVSNTFILGLFAGNTIVGYYTAADKIRGAAHNFLSTVMQAVFPHVSRLFSLSVNDGLNFVKKLLKYTAVYTFLISFGIFAFADIIVTVLLGKNYVNSVVVLRILAFLPFIISLSNVAGIQVMLNLNYKKEFTVILFGSGVFNLLISFILVPQYFAVGTSASVLLTEILVTLLMLGYLQSRKINLFRT